MVVIVREQLHILCPFHIFFDKFQIFHVLQKALLLRQISGVGSMGFQKGYLNADGNAFGEIVGDVFFRGSGTRTVFTKLQQKTFPEESKIFL